MARRRVIYARKEKPFPTNIALVEPEWIVTRRAKIRSKIESGRWAFCHTLTSLFRDGEDGWMPTAPAMCEYLEAAAGDHGSVMVMSHRFEPVSILLGASRWFQGRGWRAERYIAGREIFLARIVKGESVIDFYDLQNWLPGEIKDYAGWLGMPEGVVDRFNPFLSRLEKEASVNLFVMAGAWDKYVEWVTENSLGGFTATIASLSFGVLSRARVTRKVYRAKDQWVIKAEREAFYGGFCRASGRGEYSGQNYYLLDANGLYSYVEVSNKFPVQFRTSKKNPTERDLERVEKLGTGIVHGVFSLRDGYIPVKTGSLLTWEQEPVECWLCWPEYLWIKNHGEVLSVDQVLFYEVAELFKDTTSEYVKQARRAKMEGKKFEKTLWKMMGNSVFGKFAQVMGKSQVYPAEPGEVDGTETIWNMDTKSSIQVTIWCGSKIVAEEDDFSDTHFPAIAAFVTSYARARLFEWCTKAGWENILYNDTDSIMVNQTGFGRLWDDVQQDEPGMLRVEAMADRCFIGGKKHYEISDKVVCGSVGKNHQVTSDGGLVWTEREMEVGKGMGDFGGLYSRQRFTQGMKEKWADDLLRLEKKI